MVLVCVGEVLYLKYNNSWLGLCRLVACVERLFLSYFLMFLFS